MFNLKEKRYSVWPDNESHKQTYKSFDKYINAYNYASNFVHKYDNKPYRVILHIDDSFYDETVDTLENSNNPCDINEDFQYMPNQDFESKSEKSKKHKKDKDDKHRHRKHKKHSEPSKEENIELDSDKYNELQSQIEDFFKRDGVDIAPYAYKLAGVDPETSDDTELSNGRSIFYKKLYHEENSEGYVYSFEPSELIQLQSLISSENSLNEQRIIKFFERIVEGYNSHRHLID